MEKIKWYKKKKFWDFIGRVVAPIATVGEGMILTFDGHWSLHALIFLAIIVAAYINFYIKDENQDGIID